MLDIVKQANGSFHVKFQYKPWLVEAIKKIPGARFMGVQKAWLVPEQSGPALLNWSRTFGTHARVADDVEIGEIEELPELTIDIPLNREMFPYQRKGVAYALDKKRVIVGDEPGLGKTGQAIATMIGAKAKCVLVICPATLKENWKREIKLWSGRESIIMSDRVKTSWPQYYRVGMASVFICNYESLKKYFVERIDQPVDEVTGEKKPLRLNHIKFRETIDLFDMVIIDESHRCKDGKTQTSKFVMGIARGKEYVLALTGTPVVNKPIDLIPQLHILNQLDKFGKYQGFVNTYCQGAKQASNLKQLNYLMHKHCFYRRLKKDVLKELPDKMRNVVRVDITTRSEYQKAEERLIDYLRENLQKSEGQIDRALRGQTMVLIGILKQIAARGKTEAIIDHIREVTDAGEKIVVFAWHKEIVNELKRAIPDAVTVVGDDSMELRQRSVDAFQNNPNVKVIILNIKSGGVGITLTASSRVAFVELPWHPADADQCEDRCHRIGQKDSVQATYFLGYNTIDEYIYNIIDEKRKIVAEAIGSDESIETSMVDEFINLFSKKMLQ